MVMPFCVISESWIQLCISCFLSIEVEFIIPKTANIGPSSSDLDFLGFDNEIFNRVEILDGELENLF
jgi:hypothetical protein